MISDLVQPDLVQPDLVQITRPQPAGQSGKVNTGKVKGRVALVCMPWGSISKPSVAIGILKECARMAGFTADTYFLNVRFAARLGSKLYERIMDRSQVYAEWFFAQALFGPEGTNEMENSWPDLVKDPAAAEMVTNLRDTLGGSGSSDAACARLASEDVPAFMAESMRDVDWSAYTTVGFTTTFAQSLSSLLLAKLIKDRHPQVKIVFGGANVDSEMGVEFLNSFPWIDYVVHGEAEHSFPALLEKISDGQQDISIPGVSGRREGRVFASLNPQPIEDLNASPAPDYSDYIKELDRTGLRKEVTPLLYFESSRGCWWGAKQHCTFCGLNGEIMQFRKKAADRVYNEILHLSERYECLTFAATDNILSPDSFTDLIPRLTASDIDLDLFYEIKSTLTRERLRALRAAGVKEVQPGIESFSTRVLGLMRKGTTFLQNVQCIKWCYELDISLQWNLLYGFPGESAEDYAELPHIFRLLSHLCPPTGVGAISYQRFSPYFFDREKFGLTLRPAPVYRFIFPGSRVSLDRIAYFFDGEPGREEELKKYMAPTISVWQEWKRRWRTDPVFCYYEKGVNFLTVHDTRPAEGDTKPRYRRLRLRGLSAEIYLYCDEQHSVSAICRMLEQKTGKEVDETDVRSLLKSLVDQRVMVTEGDKYLSLAVRRKTR